MQVYGNDSLKVFNLLIYFKIVGKLMHLKNVSRIAIQRD